MNKICQLCGCESEKIDKLACFQIESKFLFPTLMNAIFKQTEFDIDLNVCEECNKKFISGLEIMNRISSYDDEFKKAWNIFINSVVIEVEKVYLTRWDCATVPRGAGLFSIIE